MKTPAILKLLWLPLLFGISVLVVLWVLWSVQQNNVNSLEQQINALKEGINKLPATVDPKKTIGAAED
jgi:type VI protein secretion system component VasF